MHRVKDVLHVLFWIVGYGAIVSVLAIIVLTNVYRVHEYMTEGDEMNSDYGKVFFEEAVKNRRQHVVSFTVERVRVIDGWVYRSEYSIGGATEPTVVYKFRSDEDVKKALKKDSVLEALTS